MIISSAPQPPALSSLNQTNLKRIKNQGCRTWKRNPRKFFSQGGTKARFLCKAEILHDAPFAAAIGACVLTSLVFPMHSFGPEDEEEGGAFDSTDARFAVMGIIGFIPYFNWLGWVFAWLDTNRLRYLVFSVVYLAPYLRTNLSLSPDESWLPIASILLCIIHIQLEASIRNGDLNGFAFFNEASKLISSPLTGKKHSPKSEDKSSETEKKQ